MAITIVVEDGTIVANANAYIDIAFARQYALDRGVTLSIVDDEVAAMIIKATDFLESFACDYQGSKTDPDNQELQWPRIDVYFDDSETAFASDAIPKNLKKAQAAAVIAVSQGLSLLPNIQPSDYVIEETVGPITTKYANPIQAGIEARFTGVDSLLAPLFGSCGSGFAIRTVRA